MNDAKTHSPSAVLLPSLSDLIEEDHHQRLLESGNLAPKRKSSLWTGEKQWVSLGYVARISEQICSSCGAINRITLGVFHRETRPGGEVKELRLAKGCQFRLDRVEIESTQVDHCPDCLMELKK